MRYAMIMAGGSGTRLWPMSRGGTPKQLLRFIRGRSLLEIAIDRLEGLIPPERRYLCAGDTHRDAILAQTRFDPSLYLGEPTARDTLNAVGYGAAVIARHDPDAVIAVFTADHLIEPVDAFRSIIDTGYALAERHPNRLVTFGIAPDHAAQGYGYLELGQSVPGFGEARAVTDFKEKPKPPLNEQYFAAGPTRYLWNSGIFVWRAATLLDCIRRYEPATHDGLMAIAKAWDTPRRSEVLASVYPTLRKTSVDYGVMEKAAKDPAVGVVAVPMPLTWLDVGSWPSFAQTCDRDEAGNATGAGLHILLDTRNTLAASEDPQHLIATLGCDDLIIIHTPQATLVCPRSRAQDIKALHEAVGKQLGPQWL